MKRAVMRQSASERTKYRFRLRRNLATKEDKTRLSLVQRIKQIKNELFMRN